MIIVHLTETELKTAHACAEGIAAFRKVFPNGLATFWTPVHALWSRIVFDDFAVWAESHKLIPSANLRYANLRYVNLTSANLTSANLTSADLTSANLRYANLQGCYRDENDHDIPGYTVKNGRLVKS